MSTTHTPTIIAACDGGDRGRQAVVLGRILAEATGAHLLIAAVYPHPGLPFPPPIAHHEDARRTTDRAIRGVRDELAPGARTVVVPGLSPAHALCKLAEERHASMLVVGSRHAQKGRHMADADHALQVLRSAHTAVLVAPDDRPVSGGVRRILVGFDDGDGSHDAVGFALELGRATGAEVRLLSVVPQEAQAWWITGAAPVDPGDLEGWVRTRREALGAAAAETLEEAGDVTTSFEVVSGSAIGELLAAAAESDLLVLGSRRWGRIARIALGSIAEPIVRRTPCPTLIVPRRHGAATTEEPRLTTSARG